MEFGGFTGGSIIGDFMEAEIGQQFDSSDPWIRRYGNNISVVLRKKTIEPEGLEYDSGDINRIQKHLPPGCGEGFDGDFLECG